MTGTTITTARTEWARHWPERASSPLRRPAPAPAALRRRHLPQRLVLGARPALPPLPRGDRRRGGPCAAHAQALGVRYEHELLELAPEVLHAALHARDKEAEAMREERRWVGPLGVPLSPPAGRGTRRWAAWRRAAAARGWVTVSAGGRPPRTSWAGRTSCSPPTCREQPAAGLTHAFLCALHHPGEGAINGDLIADMRLDVRLSQREELRKFWRLAGEGAPTRCPICWSRTEEDGGVSGMPNKEQLRDAMLAYAVASQAGDAAARTGAPAGACGGAAGALRGPGSGRPPGSSTGSSGQTPTSCASTACRRRRRSSTPCSARTSRAASCRSADPSTHPHSEPLPPAALLWPGRNAWRSRCGKRPAPAPARPPGAPPSHSARPLARRRARAAAASTGPSPPPAAPARVTPCARRQA